MMNTSQSDVIGTTRANPGETLRQARESKGWSTAQVAGQLNLTENALRQLEQGSFEQLPGHTFARGYIRAYAKLLGMDQAQMVTAFDQYTGTDATGSNVQSLGRVVEPVRLSRNLLRLFSLVLLALLIAFGYFWWQERSARPQESGNLSMEHVEVESADGTTEIHTLDEPEDQAVAEDQANTPAAPAEPLSDDAVAEAPVEAAPPAASASPGVPASAAAPAVPAPAAPVAAVPPQATVAPATPAVPAESTPAAPVVAAAGQGVVKVQFTQDCWTQLTDADGKVLFSALKRKGDSLELAGKVPMELRLGFARGVQVSYNGQPVDVTPSRGETARLKLGGQ
ncbi:helix-turn-helix domain-containing protein [Pseudomonas sp. ZM23]|uniref:Helix-turn-helix domain-containing protein n=1 Tax=Pseudomonas triclosanedens TaxID=2961893 RepID=A0ABY6ZWN0_9PSED|nr:RodZ family helix-turn-helix domain-containing protein [Pseudomonas triclosanedens]MCP8463389.1 helix-turn-helix domain-containing protein [Pseudomonas triclosanedens]MCP8469552.1 helix-turn-helix domain-containing protein [Pseudomonas triclosanedens]MCP8474190.1 helix-turn-helix domain-containing protein [Pseudomonas triclosanedens]WAI48420.1 helix-turn-helix domain-containing protein [Pseudomonas triclosanedens]